MTKDKQVIALLEKYKAGTLTNEEKAILESWYIDRAAKGTSEIGDEELDKNLALISKQLPLKYRYGAKTLWPRIAAAASIFLFLSGGAYLVLRQHPFPRTAQNQANDILPGGNKAILYANGKKFVLDKAKNGILSKQGNVLISKNTDGELTYSDYSADHDMGTVYDTLVIPRGGDHSLELADGSKVMLNADSRIRYPERFTGKVREVELLNGEAEFQIKHNASAPFHVLVKGQVIRDIGTEFDVNAYDDEPAIKTTLISGSVEISNHAGSGTLTPGQQAITHENDPIIIKTVDINSITAWANGQFYFEKTSLRELMRQVSRWYNIDVVYNGNIPDDAFDGQVSRKVKLSQMLKILQFSDVHFKIEPGNGQGVPRLIIME